MGNIGNPKKLNKISQKLNRKLLKLCENEFVNIIIQIAIKLFCKVIKIGKNDLKIVQIPPKIFVLSERID